MARPTKRGLDYFPSTLLLSEELEDVSCIYGKMGEKVVEDTIKRIYRHSFYLEYHQRTPIKLSKEYGNQLELLSESLCGAKKKSWEVYDAIIMQSVAFGVFHKELYEQFHILTSKEIQQVYFKIKERSNISELVNGEEHRYLLLNDVQSRIDSGFQRMSQHKNAIPQKAISPGTGTAKPPKFNNYQDAPTDWDALEEKIMDNYLSGGESQ